MRVGVVRGWNMGFGGREAPIGKGGGKGESDLFA